MKTKLIYIIKEIALGLAMGIVVWLVIVIAILYMSELAGTIVTILYEIWDKM